MYCIGRFDIIQSYMYELSVCCGGKADPSMTQFSVRKPYTVFVAVVAIIVFGIISYIRMTPDLMPNMDYPYVVVVTTYPGAAPEEVEAVVTKPMEQTMATLNDIKSLTSSSAENYSMLILEFEQDTNMDGAVVDILQGVQRISGDWDDTVGTPNIIRINPSMIPVMVAAVDSADMDRYTLGRFAQNTLIPALEGTTGLASVSVGGLVERTLTVAVNQEKLDAVNDRIAEAIDASLEEARQALEDAQKEIDDARDAVNAGTAQLQHAPSAMTGGMSQSADQISGIMSNVQETASQIAAAQAVQASLATQLAEAEAAEQAQRQELEALDQEIAALESDRAFYGQLIGGGYDSFPDDTSLDDPALGLDEGLIAAMQERGCFRLQEVRLQYSLADAQLSVTLAQRDALASTVDASAAQTQQLREQLEANEQRIAQLESSARQQMDSLNQMQAQLETLPSQILSGVTQISLAGGQLAAAQASLTAAQEQLDQAVSALEDQLEAAIKTADMHTIITLDMVTSLLRAQDLDMPAGYVYDENGNEVLVTVGNGIGGIDELRVLPLFDTGIDGMEPILLEDVADIYLADNSEEIYATLNGNDGLLMIFSKQSNFATARVSDNLRKTFRQIETDHPGITFTPLMDQGDYIYLIRDSILSSLGWGVVFSVLVLFLFLMDWRPTVITLLSIPISLMATLTMMYFAGVSINVMSLSGLAVSVGMLVDNSVVVIENTYRLRALGENTMRSAVSGARQVGGAVAASTLTTVCVFIPIAFVSGLTRELFTDMVLTLSFALLSSLAVALTLVPAMAGKLLEHARPRSGGFQRVMPAYRRSVVWAVKHKAVVILLALALLAGSGWLVLDRGYTFMPTMEMEQMMVTLTMPEGASFAETTAMADVVTGRILTVDGVETVGGSIVSSTDLDLTAFTAEGDVSFYVLIREKGPRASAVAADINAACADLPCTVNADANSLMSTMTESIAGSGITIRVYANDLDALRRSADAVAERLSRVEGAVAVKAGKEDPTPEIHFTVDKEKAASYGFTVAQVYMEVAKALTGSAQVMELQDGEDTYTLSVETSKKDTITPDYIRHLVLDVTMKDGSEKKIALLAMAKVTATESLATINRLNQRRYLEVTADIADGYNVTKVTDRAEEALADLELEDGVTVSFAGERESIMDALKQLLLLLVVGVLLVYLVMVGQFQNLKAPFIVMFTIPLAFTGGFLALLICGMEINILSMLGMIMLVGIIVNNGIVLVDYINQLRLAGMERREAIAEAAVTRLRPILMTSITTILGLVVMALGRTEATSLIQPLAVTCIGGLLYATLMTLYLVPVMYDIFSKKELYQVAEEDLVLSEK